MFTTTPFPVARRGIQAIPLAGDRWRITRSHGQVLGYVERIEAGERVRYRSARMLPRQARFFAIGEFHDAGEALDALRLG